MAQPLVVVDAVVAVVLVRVQAHAAARAVGLGALATGTGLPAVRRKRLPSVAKPARLGAVAPEVMGATDPRKAAASALSKGVLASLGRLPSAAAMAAAALLPDAKDVAAVPDELAPRPGPRAVPRRRAAGNVARRASTVAVRRPRPRTHIVPDVAALHGAIAPAETTPPANASRRAPTSVAAAAAPPP